MRGTAPGARAGAEPEPEPASQVFDKRARVRHRDRKLALDALRGAQQAAMPSEGVRKMPIRTYECPQLRWLAPHQSGGVIPDRIRGTAAA